MTKVFISYARDQSHGEALASEIHEKLTCIGVEAFRDTEGLNPGDIWQKKIEKNIEESDFLILVISKKTKNSNWVFCEYSLAEELDIPIIPILSESIRLPIWVRHLNYLDFISKPYDFDALSDQIAFKESKPETFNEENYYLYISDEKLKMLSQFHGDKFDRYLSLENFMEKNNEEDFEAKGYIKYNMPFKWGVVDFGVQDADFHMAMFFNKENNILLTGSAKHIIGMNFANYEYPPQYFGWSGSHLPNVVKALKSKIDSQYNERIGVGRNKEDIHSFLDRHTKYFPEQYISFLAKVLGEHEGVIIASPVYVKLLPFKIKNIGKKIKHLLVDPAEIKTREEKLDKKYKVYEYHNELDVILKNLTLKSFKRVLEIRRKASDNSISSRDCSEFLSSKKVLKYCTENLNEIPFSWSWETIASEARRKGYFKIENKVLLQASSLKTYRAGNQSSNMNILYYIGKNKITALHELVLKKMSDPDHNIQRCAAHALGEIGTVEDIESLRELCEANVNVYATRKALESIRKIQERLEK